MASAIDSIQAQVAARPVLTAASTTIIAFASWVLYDYNAWRSFGTGGTPSTPSGYWRMTKLRINRLLSSDDLCDASSLNSDTPKYLPTDFAVKHKRSGPRPRIMSRTMPQRQHPFRPSEVESGVSQAVNNMMSNMYSAHTQLLVFKPSKTEGGSADAIYAKPDLSTLNPIANEPRNKLLDKEIAHAHPADCSLHVWMSQADAKTVVEAGWGERFPLVFVDKGWIMVYAPRTMEEVKVVEEIVKAAVGWICGVAI